MNSLSILIYLADVLPRLGVVGAVASVLMFGAGIIGTIIGRIVTWERYSQRDEEWAQTLNARKTIGDYAMKMLIAASIILPISILIPSQKTFYMIAASEIGESVVTSPEAKETFNELRNIILSKLKEYGIKSDRSGG